MFGLRKTNHQEVPLPATAVELKKAVDAYVAGATDLSVSVVAEHNAGAGSVERGEYLIVGRMRADSAVIDPTNGSVPPVIYATTN